MRQKKIRVLITSVVLIICLGIYLSTNHNIKSNPTDQPKKPIKDESKTIDAEGTKVKFSPKLAAEHKFRGLSIVNVSLIDSSGMYVVSGEMYNFSDQDIGPLAIEIVLLDINSKEVLRLSGSVGPIKKGDTSTPLLIQTSENIMSAYDYKIVAR